MAVRNRGILTRAYDWVRAHVFASTADQGLIGRACDGIVCRPNYGFVNRGSHSELGDGSGTTDVIYLQLRFYSHTLRYNCTVTANAPTLQPFCDLTSSR